MFAIALVVFEAITFHVIVLNNHQPGAIVRKRALNRYLIPGLRSLKHEAAISALKAVSFLVMLVNR